MTYAHLAQEIFDIVSPFLKAAVALGATWCSVKAWQLMQTMRVSKSRDDLEKQAPSSVARVFNETVKELKATGALTPENALAARDAAVKYIREALPAQTKLLESNGIPTLALLEQFVEKAVVDLHTQTKPAAPSVAVNAGVAIVGDGVDSASVAKAADVVVAAADAAADKVLVAAEIAADKVSDAARGK